MDDLPKLNDWLHVRVSSELVERLKKRAKKDRRKLADYVRVTLENAVE
jgi:predicted DNA-binding protein